MSKPTTLLWRFGLPAFESAKRLIVLLVAIIPIVCMAPRKVLAEKPQRLLFTGALEAEFLDQAKGARDSIPPRLWDAVQAAGWQVRLAEFVVDAAPFLQGRHPRGWPAGLTWEHTDAVHLPQQRLIIVAAKRRTTKGAAVRANRVAGVMRHELGHAIDRARGRAGWRVSDSAEFQKSYAADVAAIPQDRRAPLAYYLQASPAGPQETFAELFGNLYGGGSDQPKQAALDSAFPRTRQFLRRTFPAPPQTAAVPKTAISSE